MHDPKLTAASGKEAKDKNDGVVNKMNASFKICTYCGQSKPLSDFLRRTGKRSGKGSRRGACRSCRAQRKELAAASSSKAAAEGKSELSAAPGQPLRGTEEHAISAKTFPKRRIKRTLPAPPAIIEGPDVRTLRPNRQGMIHMRGRTDKGSRWQQDIDFALAVTLVREHAAVVVNRYTIRRLYSNKSFRRYILARDNYTCFFCGGYGDTIDHLLPRAKGGHTTPMNCVCACISCNQNKGDRSLEDFMDDDIL